MSYMRTDSMKVILAAVVIAHLAVTIVHGVAHGGAHVPLTPAALAFVIVVIQLGPLVGLALFLVRPRSGAAVVAGCMAGALVFGVLNHFVLAGVDNAAQVDAEWRTLFGATAVLLALIEGGGVLVGIRAFERSGRHRF